MSSSEKVSDLSNNTKTERSPRVKARMFMITVNDKSLVHYEDIMSYLKSRATCNYVCACSHNRGVEESTKLHIHIICQFDCCATLAIRKMHGAHIDAGKFGSIQAMRKYITGETGHENIPGFEAKLLDEWGDMRKNGGGHTIGELMKMSDEDFDSEVANSDPRMFNILTKIRESKSLKIKVREWHKDVKVYYLYGPSGCGKSRKAHDMMLDMGIEEFDRVKCENGFWIRTTGEGVALYDDFRDSHMKASEFINFIDYNCQPLNIKGSSVLNKYHTIFITSVQSPNQIYKNMGDEPKLQWLRRMECINVGCSADSTEDNKGVIEKEKVVNSNFKLPVVTSTERSIHPTEDSLSKIIQFEEDIAQDNIELNVNPRCDESLCVRRIIPTSRDSSRVVKSSFRISPMYHNVIVHQTGINRIVNSYSVSSHVRDTFTVFSGCSFIGDRYCDKYRLTHLSIQ